MCLPCSQRVDFSFAFEEHGVLSDDSAEFLVGFRVDYEHAALLPDEVVVDFDCFFVFEFFEVFEL